MVFSRAAWFRIGVFTMLAVGSQFAPTTAFPFILLAMYWAAVFSCDVDIFRPTPTKKESR